MLETEIKKLTAALEANTAALTAGGATQSDAAPAAVIPNVPVPTVAPVTTPPPTAVAPAVATVAPVTPPAPSLSEITKDQVLQELSAVNQKLGDNGVKLNALFEQMYPGHNLTTLDPAQYGTIITAARGLVA